MKPSEPAEPPTKKQRQAIAEHSGLASKPEAESRNKPKVEQKKVSEDAGGPSSSSTLVGRFPGPVLEAPRPYGHWACRKVEEPDRPSP